MIVRQRMDCTLSSNTRQPHQQLNLKINDTVDLLVEIGPSALDYQVARPTVRRCTQDIRRALHYAVFHTMTTTSVIYSIHGNGQLRRRSSAAESQMPFARENLAYYTSVDDFAPRFVAPRPRAQSVDTDRSRTDRKRRI